MRRVGRGRCRALTRGVHLHVEHNRAAQCVRGMVQGGAGSGGQVAAPGVPDHGEVAAVRAFCGVSPVRPSAALGRFELPRPSELSRLSWRCRRNTASRWAARAAGVPARAGWQPGDAIAEAVSRTPLPPSRG